MPVGALLRTGSYFLTICRYPNLNGWAYLMAVVQHPYAESDQSRLADGDSLGKSGAYINTYTVTM